MDQQPFDTEVPFPYPPRFWWLKRITMVVAAMVTCLIAVRLWWGWEAGRRLEAQLAIIRARGEPLLPADFGPLDIPDEQNAAYHLKLAAAAMDQKIWPPSNYRDYEDVPPFPRSWWAQARSAVAANQKVFRHVRDARRCDRADWGVRFATPVYDTPGPASQHSVVHLLADAAMLAHLKDDDAEAVELLRDLLHVVSGVEQRPWGRGAAYEPLLFKSIIIMAPGLTPRAPASRASVVKTIDELLRERHQDEKVRWEVFVRRMLSLDAAEFFGHRGYTLRPMFKLEAAKMLRWDEQMLRAVAEPNWPTGSKFVPALTWSKLWMKRVARFTGLRSSGNHGYIYFGSGSTIKCVYRLRADRRMAAVALAVRLYQIDHGEFPSNLAILVPKYLPAVPVDPMAPDGRPLGYLLAQNGTRPVVYSVGEDGSDQTLDETYLPTTPCFSQTWGVPDEWRELSRWYLSEPADKQIDDPVPEPPPE